VTGRQKASAFFITLTAVLIAVAIYLNVSWIIIHWRRVVPLVVGMIFFALIIAGMIVNTIFLVREFRRNDQHDSFINSVTHELKTPIASIKLYLETLRSREVSEEKRKEFYSIMLADADRLHYTVDQVLKAGLAGQKRRRLDFMEVDVAMLARDAVEIGRRQHNLSPEQLRVQAPELPEAALVTAIAEELLIAIGNLIDNAVKYSDDGVDIEVAVVPREKTIDVEVRDRGVGIPRADLGLVFDRFYRSPSSPARKVRGTGLGLFIVRSIVKRHGGSVHALSAGEGRGSTFVIEIPRVRS